MKKTKTSSPSVIIMENLDKKVVRKYKRKIRTPYPITVPEKKILKLLKYTNIKHPKIVKKGFRYFEEEFVEGRPLVLPQNDKTVLINLLSHYMFEMKKLNPSPIKRHIKWNNNSEFLYMQVKHLEKEVKRYKHKPKLEQMGLSLNQISAFKNIRLDDSRKMSLIHCDIRKENILSRYGEYYLIDWEHATYGDIAYEFAMHFVRERYNEKEMNIILERMCSSLLLDPTSLMRDIKVYMNFETLRLSFYKLNEACELAKKKQDYNEVLNYVYDFYDNLQSAKPKEELRRIISN